MPRFKDGLIDPLIDAGLVVVEAISGTAGSPAFSIFKVATPPIFHGLEGKQGENRDDVGMTLHNTKLAEILNRQSDQSTDEHILVHQIMNDVTACKDVNPHRHLIMNDTMGDFVVHQDHCLFRAWEYLPGPGDDDFECTLGTVDETIDAILNYYFGQPTTIDGWIVPLHRHPELNCTQVSEAIARAKPITRKEFNELMRRYDDLIEEEWKRLRMSSTLRQWPAICHFRFLTLRHQQLSEVLMLRRNPKEDSYIIAD